MRFIWIVFLLLVGYACRNPIKDADTVLQSHNYLNDFSPYTSDSLINVVIEIPAGCNQKWEVNKQTGYIEQERINDDSLRVINYLPYPANYGFIPQTLSDKSSGGDGDPADVFVLGGPIERGNVVTCRIIGFIEMTDNGEVDDKFIALPVQTHWKKISSLKELNQYYPGSIEILQIWLTNYKGEEKVKVLSVNDEESARNSLYEAIVAFKERKNEKIEKP